MLDTVSRPVAEQQPIVPAGEVALEAAHDRVLPSASLRCKGALAHYLIVSQTHVSSFDQLPDAAGAEPWAIKRDLKARLQPIAFATVERSGDMGYNGGSVTHLHAHFVALDANPAATVRFRVSAYAGDSPARAGEGLGASAHGTPPLRTPE